jgi:hypothetical protein
VVKLDSYHKPSDYRAQADGPGPELSISEDEGQKAVCRRALGPNNLTQFGFDASRVLTTGSLGLLDHRFDTLERDQKTVVLDGRTCSWITSVSAFH